MSKRLNKKYGVTPYNEFDPGIESKVLGLSIPLRVVYCSGSGGHAGYAEMAVDCYGEYQNLSRVYTSDDYGYLMTPENDIEHEQAVFLHWRKEIRKYLMDLIQGKKTAPLKNKTVG